MHHAGGGDVAGRELTGPVEYADGDNASAFAQVLGGLIEANVTSRPEKRRDLESLDALWSDGLGAAYEEYLHLGPDPRVALAAALVETALDLQGLGQEAAQAGQLLLADQRLQVGFARAIENVSTCAAAGQELPSVRGLLTRTVKP